MRRLHTALLSILFAMLAIATTLAPAAAQTDLSTTFYAYTNTTSGSMVMLGVGTSTNSGMAAEMVSPRYTDDFFAGFDIFTGYDFAQDLTSSEIAIVSQADEYMVFTGTLDSYNGLNPGYVIFLSSNATLFIVIGYQSDAEDMFEITDEILTAGEAPVSVPGFTRTLVNSSDDAGSGSSSGSSSSGSQGSSGFSNVICNVDPNLAPIDFNGDSYLDQEEMAAAALVIDEAQEVLNFMIANDIDAIQYQGC